MTKKSLYLLIAVFSGILILAGCNSGGGTDPPAGGAISGTITFSGGGVITITAMSGNSETPYAVITINGPGDYTIPNLANGAYALFAFVDNNGSGLPDFGEPYGIGDAVTVAGEEVDNIDINIESGVSGVTGTITYNGVKSGTIILTILGPSSWQETLAGTFPIDYQVENLAPGTYAITAFIDLDDSGIVNLGEPAGGATGEIDGAWTNYDFTIEDAPEGTSAINGEITYNGAASPRQVYVLGGGAWLGTDEIAGPGFYALEDLPEGAYMVSAYMDSDNNGMMSVGDPVGFFGGTVEVDGVNPVYGIDITLEDTDADASISGTVEYYGFSSGDVYLMAIGASFTPVGNAELDDPGDYEIDSLSPGTYFVSAFIDANDDGMLGMGEPFGFAEDAVELSSGEQAVGIDLFIVDW